ncbi:MAG: 30S ribosomal protein S16, partial [Gammaproteobacteria bacterium TMED78]
MVTIRLSRVGAKKRPFYHIVVTDSRSKRDGKYLERLGFFNPMATNGEEKIKLDDERLAYWVSNGAQLAQRVDSIVRENNETPEETSKRIARKEKKRLKKLESKKQTDNEPKEEAVAEEKPKEEAVAEEKPKEEAVAEEK